MTKKGGAGNSSPSQKEGDNFQMKIYAVLKNHHIFGIYNQREPAESQLETLQRISNKYQLPMDLEIKELDTDNEEIW